MEDQLLEDVYVDVEVADDEFEVLDRLPIKALPFNSPAPTYIIVKLPEDASLTTSFANTLRFVVKDVNAAGPNDPGISDEYAVRFSSLFKFLLLIITANNAFMLHGAGSC